MNDRHELFKFMRQVSKDMAMEYARILKRATEDPGTAGDEGEESWAELLRNWLPATYHVVTKGRILFEDDSASPQVDVLVLTPNYPVHLRNKKMYFAGGVVAAFECKLTLKAKHLVSLAKTAEMIKSRTLAKHQNPYEDYNSTILYGLLAHSHSWTKNKPVADQVFNIMGKIIDKDKGFEFDNARLYPDFVCVSDTAMFCYQKRFILNEEIEDGEQEILDEIGSRSALSLSYDAYWSDDEDSWLYGIVHGTLISFITRKMAYYDSTLRNLSTYIQDTNISAASVGFVNNYGIGVEDFVIDNYYREGGADNPWNPWGKNF